MSKLSLGVEKIARSLIVPGIAEQMLAVIGTPAEAKRLESLAAAARRYADSLESRNYAVEIQLRAGRRGGQMLIEMAERGERAMHPGVDNGPLPTLADLGVEPMRSSRWQKLARKAEDDFEEIIAAAKASGEEITVTGIGHVAHNTGQIEWYTPAPLIEAVREVMGGIDLDPASNATANAVIQAERYFTREDDGLSQDWEGRVWLNPPYAQPACAAFCLKLVEAHQSGAVPIAMAILNNSTETRMFQALAAVSAALCFPLGRVPFWHTQGGGTSNLQGQAVFYLGPDVALFRRIFDAFGLTVRR